MTSGPDPRDAPAAANRTRTLDGLRGIAVVAVVIEHAWPRVLPGGFAGVDVFFVLSGFLITRILVKELAATGRIDLWAFYARRVRRILPASLVTVVATCLLYVGLLGPALPKTMTIEALSATFSFSNLVFASQSVDYFASDPTSSPFLHFWSLAVEEQFYLVWPTLLVAVAFVAHRLFGAHRGWVPIAAVALLGLGSLALAIRGPQASAFFLLPQRGWELIVGGLLAWLQVRGQARLPVRLAPYRWVGVVAGFALLAVTFVFAPELGTWPGPATLMPVLGTVLLVAAGDAMPGAHVLVNTPLQFMGRISYALYLWHWPVLAAVALVSLPAIDPPIAMTVGAVIVAIAVATVSTILMEEPIRSSRIPALVGRRGILTGLASMALVGVVSVGLTRTVPAALASTDPFSTALAKSRTDRERIIKDKCTTPMHGAGLKDCVYGALANEDGSPTHNVAPEGPVVVLFGDSHAMHWFAAVDRWAREQGYALVPLMRSACAPVDAPLATSDLKMRRQCSEFRAQAQARIAALDPALVVVSGSIGSSFLVDGEVVRPADGLGSPWVGATSQLLTQLDERAGTVVLLNDVPRPGFNAPDCLAVHRGSPAACSLPLEDAVSESARAAQRAAAERAGVAYIDPTAWLCDAVRCDWMAGQKVAWFDDHHLTASGAISALPGLGPALTALAGGTVSAAAGAPSQWRRSPRAT